MEEDLMTRCKGQHVQCEDLGMFWYVLVMWIALDVVGNSLKH